MVQIYNNCSKIRIFAKKNLQGYYKKVVKTNFLV